MATQTATDAQTDEESDDSSSEQEMAVFFEDRGSGDLILLLRTTAATVDEAVRKAVESGESSARPELVDGQEFFVMHDLGEPMEFTTYDVD